MDFLKLVGKMVSIEAGTHNGKFHSDDVLSYVFLREMFNISLKRTRDKEVLNALDLVFDVNDGIFDHHKLDTRIRENGIQYAAFGLLWDYFAKEYLLKYFAIDGDNAEFVKKTFDEIFIQKLDAIDNGYGDFGKGAYNLSQIVSCFNLSPFEDYTQEKEDAAFFKAVDLVQPIFDNALKSVLDILNGEKIVIDAFEQRISKHIVVLEKACSWKGTLYKIDEHEEVLYVIHPDSKGGYDLIGVNVSLDSFDLRKALPEAWREKRFNDLNQAVGMGVTDAVFCHKSGFLAIADSYESIIKMADYAVNN